MATKKLSERVDDATISIAEVSEAIDGVDAAVDGIKGQVKQLSKAVDALRKLMENVSELFDDVTDALAAIESNIEEYDDLKLDKQSDVLNDALLVFEEIEFTEDE